MNSKKTKFSFYPQSKKAMKNNLMKNSLIVITLLTLATAGIAPAMAASTRFSFGPANPDLNEPEILHYELRPGDTVSEEVTATNGEDTPATFSVYPADTEYNSSLSLTYKGKNDPRALESAWITVDENEFVLKPHEEKKIKFTLAVPKDAQVSDAYLAGIILERIVETPEKSTLKYRAAIVIPVKLTVTLDPKPVTKYWQANLFNYVNTPPILISLGIFCLAMTYFVRQKIKEKKLAHEKK